MVKNSYISASQTLPMRSISTGDTKEEGNNTKKKPVKKKKESSWMWLTEGSWEQWPERQHKEGKEYLVFWTHRVVEKKTKGEKGKDGERNGKRSSLVSEKTQIKESWNYKSREVKRTCTPSRLIPTLRFISSPFTTNPIVGLGSRRTISPFTLLAMHCPQC